MEIDKMQKLWRNNYYISDYNSLRNLNKGTVEHSEFIVLKLNVQSDK